MRIFTIFAASLVSTAAIAAPPGPAWDFEDSAPDPVWSETYYPVARGAVVPRERSQDESPAEAESLNRAWEAGIRTYLRRVSHMVAGMNLPDDVERMQQCAAMGELVHAGFIHREGRRLGFARRKKADLMAACANRAFRLSGFYALRISAEVVSPDLVQVTTCYYHDQRNDPKVIEGLTYPRRVLPNAQFAVPRVSVETITRDAYGTMRIALHVALDSDNTLITKGCARN